MAQKMEHSPEYCRGLFDALEARYGRLCGEAGVDQAPESVRRWRGERRKMRQNGRMQNWPTGWNCRTISVKRDLRSGVSWRRYCLCARGRGNVWPSWVVEAA